MSSKSFFQLVFNESIDEYVQASILFNFYAINNCLDYEAFRNVMMLLKYQPKPTATIAKSKFAKIQALQYVVVKNIFNSYARNNLITFDDFWLICYNYNLDFTSADL